jgi:hypothetical protein
MIHKRSFRLASAIVSALMKGRASLEVIIDVGLYKSGLLEFSINATDGEESDLVSQATWAVEMDGFVD